MDTAQFTVIVRCADPRLDAFFEDPAIRTQMDLAGHPEPLTEATISNVGGLLPLSGAEVPRLLHDAGLLLGLFGGDTGRIVLTAHTSCGGYEDAVPGGGEAVRVRQEDDLRTAAGRLLAELGAVTVDCYYLDTEDRMIQAVAY